MEHINLPKSIDFKDTEQPNVGQVVVTPCQQGYGTTLGNALRRVLLSSLPGAAVESIKIEGVQHEFSAVEGVLEDVVEIILNIKQMAVKSYSDGPITLSLSKKGKGDVFAGDFEKNADVEIVSPGLKIMTITDDNKQLNMEVTIGKGSGYIPVAEKDTRDLSLGTIAIDSLYTPIRDIGYNVELTRVGDVTDYEKLTITIETNGTVSPKEAISQATKILMDHFALILDAAGQEASKTSDDSLLEITPEDNESEEDVMEETPEEEADKEETPDEEGEKLEEEKPKKRGRKKKTEDK